MTIANDAHLITSIEHLESIYEQAVPASLAKETAELTEHYRALIAASPFVVLATSGPEGLDCSPRGDPKGFVRVADSRTLMIPDRRGNNRIDSLRNIVRDPRVALLFLIPGKGETFRVNGRAHLNADPALCESFAMQGKPPKCVIVITIETSYFQCQKAIARSKLWDPSQHAAPGALPTAGTIIAGMTNGEIGGPAYDAAYPERMKQTMY